ncbi:unnamed protein product [Rotaria sp. Silwood2]|nr:unnamed protein product [Rotaria sp. Silwood2]CAF2916616.1 unnamed protein product [Rotaria sp. Silwood2]CAF4226940.1 unnamed protein product [Rotaria sp. Silwood2]CAF4349587.1 unnamed protein product [Rotaria sp. Silwood2]
MASKISKIDELSKKTGNTILNPSNSTSSQTANYYFNWKETDRIDFTCLEKGLLLFIYIYETSESALATEMLFWDHQLCVDMITTGKCSKSSNQCRREHQTSYRQTNLCPQWYANNRCTFGEKCEDSHRLEGVPNENRYIRTETDADVFKLLRFIRNFAGHYIESVIHDQQELNKDVLVVMVHLVHALSRKNAESIEHLNLFLETSAMNQMITKENLLSELDKSFSVPAIFFDLRLNYSAAWYRPTGNKRDVNFNQLSPAFVTYFNRIFVEYYQGRLKSRGAKPAWS